MGDFSHPQAWVFIFHGITTVVNQISILLANLYIYGVFDASGGLKKTNPRSKRIQVYAKSNVVYIQWLGFRKNLQEIMALQLL